MAFCFVVFFHRISNIKFQISRRFRIDGDISKNAPRADVDLFCVDLKDAFSKISGCV